MKLSDAIEAGFAVVKQQAFRHYFDMYRDIDADGRHRIMGACALGCAYIGLHPEAMNAAPSNHEVSDELRAMWPNEHDAGVLARIATQNDVYWPIPDIVAGLRYMGA